MRRIILLVVFICSVFTIQAQETVNWISFNKALELNKENPKPILLDIYTDWCGPCKQMERVVYGNKLIAERINKDYYAVKINGEGKESVTYQGKTFTYDTYKDKNGRPLIYNQFAGAIFNAVKKQGGKSVYPTTVFFDDKSQFIQAVPGYLPEPRFEKILGYFGEDAYKNNPWPEYEKEFKSSF